jgi:hypothetical protein
LPHVRHDLAMDMWWLTARYVCPTAERVVPGWSP